MKEIGRISADIVAQRSLKVVPVVVPRSCPIKTKKRGVVPELSPIKTFWLGQVESEQDKRKTPENRMVPGFLSLFDCKNATNYLLECWLTK